jgi:hypothetical protein
VSENLRESPQISAILLKIFQVNVNLE